jgi:hypothetical protein
LVRTFEVGLTAALVVGTDVSGTVTESASVTVQPETGELRLEGGESKVRIAQLEDAGFEIVWLRLSPGGAWMVRVYDRDGNWTDGSIQDDPVDALLAVAERLLPPGG